VTRSASAIKAADRLAETEQAAPEGVLVVGRFRQAACPASTMKTVSVNQDPDTNE